MIVDKGQEPGEVVTIKLTSGEELVTKLVETLPMHYVVSKPLVLTMGQQGIGMVPYLFTVHPSKDVRLAKATVTVIANTDPDAAKQYLESTSGIKLA